jgi:serine/threonine protein kinase
MITVDHQVSLAGFGLMTIISDSLSAYARVAVRTGNFVRWMAPEVLNPERFGFTHCSPLRQSDVYAFGMVIYEVCVMVYLFQSSDKQYRS